MVTTGREQATRPPTGLRGSIVGFVGLVIASLLWVILYKGVIPRFKGRYIGQLFLDRGYFQYVSTFLFLIGAVLVMISLIWVWRERGAWKHAAKITEEILLPKWRGRIAEGHSSGRFAAEDQREQRDQGKDILSALVVAGCATFGKESDPSSVRLLPALQSFLLRRIHRIGLYLYNTRAQNVGELLDTNRDLSSLDSDRLSGRFTFIRYVVYLIPVIGFLGTVWGIGQAMSGISDALPSIKDLEGFINSLGGATHALQVAFDTTLLALLLSGALTLVLTLGTMRSDAFLVELDTWVLDNFLCYITEHGTVERSVVSLERTVNKGFIVLAGAQDRAVYDGGLRQIKSTLDETTAMLAKSADAAQTREDRSRQILEDLTKSVRERGARLNELCEKMASACAEIRQMQVSAQDRIKELARALPDLPRMAQTLDSAAEKLTQVATKLGDVGTLAETIGQAQTALSEIRLSAAAVPEVRDALAKHETDGQGQSRRVDTISAIIDMRNALAQELSSMSKRTDRQLDLAQRQAQDAGAFLQTAIKNMNNTLATLTGSFLDLAQELRQLGGQHDEGEKP